ncbi:MAG: purine-nucleoside phosphorylase [Clostridiales bacterium]|nr:purine-nucleoside phosphorylase [Clostridiales bacterium]
MSTPHIKAEIGDFAKTVLMPGDPLRSKFIAENFIDNARLVNNVRGVQGYTGTYNGVPVSVMASGMGMPSIGIYSYELFNFFGVENIIRIGSAGAILKDVKLRDIVVAMGACTDSNFASGFGLPGTFAPIADYGVLSACMNTAGELGINNIKVGNVLSSDIFYYDSEGLPDYMQPPKQWAKMGVLAIEMESAALYMNASRAGKRALGMFTVSDNLVTGESLDSDARQTSFTDMMKLALETTVKLDKTGVI